MAGLFEQGGENLLLHSRGGTMNTKLLVASCAVAVIACGGSSTNSSSSQTVTASTGATLTAGAATLTIPPAALTHDTTVTVREAEPQHAGRVARIEVEPHDALVAGHVALLSFKLSDGNVRVKMHQGTDDSLKDVEVDDRNHHAFKTSMSVLGTVEVEVEHGTTCASACAPGQECEDGACMDHDHAAAACSTVCTAGEECDDGVCKTHDQCAMEHHRSAGTCSPACASGLTCHDGVCSAHH